MVTDESPFADLPAALVEEMLKQTSAVGDLLLDAFRQVKADKSDYRQSLVAKGLLIHESSLGYPPIPTTCGADGSYAIERLLSADLAAAAAVVVEGLTPPSENRFWDQPRHSTFVAAEVHRAETATILRAVMIGEELTLASKAPHDLVMIDGTLTLPMIYFNQALTQAFENRSLLSSERFISQFEVYLEAYRVILQSKRTDKHYIGVPKYSTHREIGHAMEWPTEHDDRGLLTWPCSDGAPPSDENRARRPYSRAQTV